MNKFICRVVCAEDCDEDNNPINIKVAFYCENEEEAEKIVEFMSEVTNPNAFWLVEKIPLLTFDVIFKTFMNDNFGGAFDDKVIN